MNSTKRRCCLCGKEHAQCSAFTLARDLGPWPWQGTFPREVCQRCADLNSLLWGEPYFPVPWYRRRRHLWTMTWLRLVLLAFGYDPTDFLIGVRR